MSAGAVAVIAVCGLVGTAIPSKPSRPTASAPTELVPPHRMLREFTDSAGQSCWAVLLERPVSDHETLALARMLRRVYPGMHFLLVDDASGIDAYARWAEGAAGGARAPFPQAWFNRHARARCQRWLGGRWGCERYQAPDGTPLGVLDL